MVKILNGQIFPMLMALNEFDLAKLPPRQGLRVVDLQGLLGEKWTDIDKVRQVVLGEAALKDENDKPKLSADGKNVLIDETKQALFEAQMQEIMEQEFEVAVTLPIADFGDAPISVVTMRTLRPLITT